MAVFMGAFPVLPGKEDEPRKFAQETLDRGEEFDASQRRLGITTEEWWLQQAATGSMVLVRFESPDVAAAFAPSGSRTRSSTSGSRSVFWISPASTSPHPPTIRCPRSFFPGRPSSTDGVQD